MAELIFTEEFTKTGWRYINTGEKVVRCGYCKWYREGAKTNYCDKLRRITGDDGFCAWAEEMS